MSKLGPASPTVALRHLPLTAYYAALGAWRSGRAHQLRATVLVAGAPRSGTSWLGEVVAGLAGRPLLYEPTQVGAVPQMRDGHRWCGRPFREPGERDHELAADLERLLTGRYLGPGLVQRSREIDGALWSRTPLVTKVVDLNLLLPWVAVNLPWLRIVLVVRHPLAVAASQEAFLEAAWSSRTRLTGPYERFIAAHPEYTAPTSYASAAERLVTTWAIEHAWLRDRARDLGSVITVRYEDLRADLPGRAAGLAAQLGLPTPSPELIDHLGTPSASVNPAASTLGGSASDGWRRRYRGDELRRLRAILARYGNPFYGPASL